MISLSGLGAAPGGYQTAQAEMLRQLQTKADQQGLAGLPPALLAALGIDPQQAQSLPGMTAMPPQSQPLAPPQAAAPPAFPSVGTMQPNQGRFDDFNQGGGGGPSPLLAALQARAAFPNGALGMSQPAPQQPPLAKADAQPTRQPIPPAPAASPPTQVAAGGPAAQPPQQAAQPIRLPSTAGIRPGTLTWASVVNAIKAANPTISPLALGSAVKQFLPFMENAQAQQWKAIEANQNQQKIDQTAASATSDVSDIVARIKSGEFPPPGATGSSNRYPAALNGRIAQELAKDSGWNLSAHVLDWNAMYKNVNAQNSPQTGRFVAAIDSAYTFLDTFKTNIDEWNSANLPTFVNDGILKIRESNIIPDAAAQKRAALIKSQYAELVNLIGSVFQSGGVPTDAARRLAAEQLNLGWSRGTLDAVIEQIQGLLQDRKSSIRNVGPYTPGGAQNSYMPTQAPGATPSAAPPAAAPAAGPQEGATATGPNGQRLILRNGQWVPFA